MEHPVFNDLKVLELSTVLAGPSVGQFFAELGAEVTKVENFKSGGDVTRTWKGAGEQTDDRSAYFCSVNWGKRSIGVDLSSSEGRKIVLQLASRSDVVIASFKPGDAVKLGVDYPTLAAVQPNLIYGIVTGYGTDNERVGYDAVIQAEAGFMDLNGERNGPPQKLPVALIDVLAGHHLKEALLLSILKRERSGKGDFVQVSLIQAAVASLVNQASNWLISNILPKRMGSSHPNIAPYGDFFETIDGRKLLLAVGSDSQFGYLCKILNINYLINDFRFSTNSARVINREELNALLSKSIKAWKSAELNARLRIAHIPAGIIQNVEELFDSSEAKSMLIQNSGLTGVSGFASDGKVSHLNPPPHLGEHTSQILEEAGYDTDQIAALRQSGVIG